ncbi:hypothetical protein L1887_08270 [Cichorium endivia]|nr:hypothetical protein L1887_08270 [Cichorium endivia]
MSMEIGVEERRSKKGVGKETSNVAIEGIVMAALPLLLYLILVDANIAGAVFLFPYHPTLFRLSPVRHSDFLLLRFWFLFKFPVANIVYREKVVPTSKEIIFIAILRI